MKHPLRFLASALLLTTTLTCHASADLLVNGNFTGVADSSSANLTYGQFGSASGSTLSIPGWSTSGYNFVYTPGTADRGTKAGGQTSGVQESPGQFPINDTTKANNGYGSQFLWGKYNAGTVPTGTDPFTNLPFSGNFVAADGAYEVGAVTTAVGALKTGIAYTLTFYWAAAQQESYTGATTEQWQVTLGSQTQSTTQYSLPSQATSGWMKQTFIFIPTAASSSAVLSFLAVGTPGGEPPFVLLGGVSLVPEPSSGTLLALIGVGLTAVGIVRRRRRASVDAEA